MLTGCSYAGSELVLTDYADEGQSSAAFLSSAEAEEIDSEPEVKTTPEIFVYVCGAVVSPGVYELGEGSRVIDAVTLAGGLLEDADETFVNLAAALEDGVKLMIPYKEELQDDSENSDKPIYDQKTTAGQKENENKVRTFDSQGDSGIITKSLYGFDDATNSGGLVNINQASVEELKTLPGIGDGIAARIVKYREENGKFSSIEDIMKISGIKEKLFDKIKDSITV